MKIVEYGHEQLRVRNTFGGHPARLRIGFLAIASALLSIAAMSPVIPASADIARVNSTPQGWVAHSAYDLQLSVPKSWAVAYFQNCPVHGSGTLLIGTPTVVDFCTAILGDVNIVTMHPEALEVPQASHEKHLLVHGLSVTSYSVGGSVEWDLSSMGIVIDAMGPKSSAVLDTLTRATLQARAAPGMIKGSEYLEALTRVPVSGPVSVTRLGAHERLPAAHAFFGQFSDTLPPGIYRLTGYAGSAPCSTITAIVKSGRTTHISEIDCQGD